MTYAQQIWDACEHRTEIGDIKHLMEYRDLKKNLCLMTQDGRLKRLSKGVYIRAGNRPEDGRRAHPKLKYSAERVWGI